MDRAPSQLIPSQDAERPAYVRVDVVWTLSSRIFHLLTYRPDATGDVALCWCGVNFEDGDGRVHSWEWTTLDGFDPFAFRMVEDLPGVAGRRSRTLCLNCWRLARAHLTGRGPGSPPLLAGAIPVPRP